MNNRYKHSVLIGTVAAVGLLLAGCTPGGSAEDPSSSMAPPPSTQASQGVISPQLPPVPELDGAQGIRSSVTLAQCTMAAGPVEANGEATNSTGKTADIVIAVDWATATSDVVARGVAVLKDVEPGATVPWSAKAQLDYKDQVNCIPTAQAGKLK